MVKHTVGVCWLLLCLAAGNAFGAEAPSPDLSDAELAELVALLDDAQDQLMARLTGMTDEQWSFKQNPDRWSVGECVEHIVLAESGLLGKAEQVVAGPADPEWFSHTDGQLARIEQFVPQPPAAGSAAALQAPDELQPTQRWDRSRAIRGVLPGARRGARVRRDDESPEIKNRTV